MAIKTNWYLVAGAPSSGKTKVMECLASLGYATLSEVSREIINTELNQGKNIQEVRGDDVIFQDKVLQAKIEVEESLSPEEMIFLDGGGLPSSIAYYQASGLDSKRAFKEAKKRRYKGVFVFERLPLIKDYARTEDENMVSKLDKLIREAYESLGYEVISVPVMSVEERAKFIIDKLDKKAQLC